MNLAAPLQIVGGALIAVAAFLVSPTFGIFAAGLFLLGFGIWEELSS